MQLNLPEQRYIPGIDTRPRALRDWLATLPYVDAENTASRIIERLHNINHQLLPAGQRLEILADFRHSYERLFEALRQGTRKQDVLTRPRSLALLTDFTEQLSYGYKYALRDALNERQRWGRSKNLVDAANFSQNFLALTLMCRYQAYQPVPDLSWSEIGGLVRFAETQGLAAARAPNFPLTTGELHALTVYRQLALLRLADPYRMTDGLLWEAYTYIAGKVEHIELLNRFEGNMPSGVFGLSLDREPHQSQPAPTSGVERNAWRWLDARALIQHAQEDLKHLIGGTLPQRVGFSTELTGNEAIQLLGRMLGQWTRSLQRKSPRLSNSTAVELSPGLDAAYFFLNNCVAFDPNDYLPDQDDDDFDYSMSSRNVTVASDQNFRLIGCPTRNRSGGGLSLYVGSRESLSLRVSQLVLINLPGQEGATEWLVGVVRWLINQDGKGVEAGVQYVARSSTPVVLRATEGVQRPYQPALASEITLSGGQKLAVLIAAKGLFRERGIVEMLHAGETVQIRCQKLLEAGHGFERFCYEVLS